MLQPAEGTGGDRGGAWRVPRRGQDLQAGLWASVGGFIIGCVNSVLNRLETSGVLEVVLTCMVKNRGNESVLLEYLTLLAILCSDRCFPSLRSL